MMVENTPRTATPRPASQPDAPAPRQEGQLDVRSDSDHAARFASALARHKDGKNGGKLLDGSADLPPDTAAQLARALPDRPLLKKDDKQDDPGQPLSAVTHDKGGQQATGEMPSPTAAAAASQVMTAEFAARLALPQGGLAQSHVQLDERLYAVSNIVIESGSTEGLSISYETSADSGTSHSDREDSLRQRLEARGLTVGTVSGTSAG